MKKDDQNSTVMRTGSLYWKRGGGGARGGRIQKNQKILIITVTIKTETDEGGGADDGAG